MSPPHLLPRWLLVAYSLWIAVWIPSYWVFNGPANFLWLCDAVNLLTLIGLWRGSRLILSAQAVGVLLIQAVWALDFLARLVSGHHLVGGTEYMFDTAEPLWLRGCSLFHLWVPLLLLWTMRRLGYDRRAPWLQSAVIWVLLPATYLLSAPELNINWLHAPFGVPQTLVAPLVWLGISMVLYPLVLFWPTHFLLAWVERQFWAPSQRTA